MSTSEVTQFTNKTFGSVRAFVRNGEPWFVANDVANALGYSDPNDAVRKHCKYTELLKTGESPVLTNSPRGINVIPESDVYALIFRSALPAADAFRRWVCEEVLPSIRKTGQYSAQQEMKALPPLQDKVSAARIIFETAQLSGNQLVLALDKIYRASTDGESALGIAEIALVSPKAEQTLTPTQIGKQCSPELSPQVVNALLKDGGYQSRIDNVWEPTEKAYGMYELLDTNKRHSDGTPIKQLKWYSSIVEVVRKLVGQSSQPQG